MSNEKVTVPNLLIATIEQDDFEKTIMRQTGFAFVVSEKQEPEANNMNA